MAERSGKVEVNEPRARCVSRRGWKVAERKRSSTGRPASLSKSYEKKKETEKNAESLRKIKREIEQRKKAAEEKRKEMIRSRIERKRESERKAEVFQKVSASKVKRMNRKKLRGIRKVNDSSLIASQRDQ